MSSTAPSRDALTIAGPAGHIEALLEEPANTRSGFAAVICHPHPQHQGTMMNKVVHTLSRAMNDLAIPAIRFNFRGVGASEGNFAEGLGETDDALAVIEWARAREANVRLVVLGFSFGGMVASRAAMLAGADGLVTVAPAAGRMSALLEGSQPECPWLIVQGDADEVVPCDEVVAWVDSLAPGPELIVLPDVGHFFHGRLTQLRETVVNHLGENWDLA